MSCAEIGVSRRGHGIVPLDLPGQADERGGVLQGDGRLTCFEALVGAPEHEGGKVIDAGTRSCPAGRDGKETFIHAGARPPGAGAGCADQGRQPRSWTRRLAGALRLADRSG